MSSNKKIKPIDWDKFWMKHAKRLLKLEEKERERRFVERMKAEREFRDYGIL